MAVPTKGSLALWVHVDGPPGRAPQDFDLLLPTDLPSGGHLEFELPANRLTLAREWTRLATTPILDPLGQGTANAAPAIAHSRAR